MNDVYVVERLRSGVWELGTIHRKEDVANKKLDRLVEHFPQYKYRVRKMPLF